MATTGLGGLGGAAAMALCGAVFVLAGMPTAAPAGPARHVIRAHDPAGVFTVELVGEQLVAASIAGEAVPRSRIVQDGKQVRLLGTGGDVALALDVEPPGIRWNARPPAAR